MLKATFNVVGFTAIASFMAQAQQPPGFDIYLADLKQQKIVEVENISSRKGYDNQPYFANNGLYYTAAFKTGGVWQTDIVFYDFKTKEKQNITKTKVSEYSPTLMNSEKSLSAIVVEHDGSQKLWQYPLQKELKPSRIYQNLAPVGYHAWGEQDELVTFILGEPHSLYFGNAEQQTAKSVAKNIGRTLAYNQTLGQYSFSQYNEKKHWLTLFNPKSELLTPLYQFPEGVDYYAWFDQQHIIYAHQAVIYKWALTDKGKAQKWLDLSSYCATNVSRLAYSQNANKLAFVCAE